MKSRTEQSRVVCGLGQCSWDYLAVLDSFPDPDTKVEVRNWTEQGGGPVATALVALRRLGVHGRFAGVCGSDDTGERIRRSLAAEHIDVEYLRTRSEGTSQKAFIAIDTRGMSRTIFWTRPGAPPLEASEISEEFLEGADALILDGLMADASLRAAHMAREAGIPVMLDAGRIRPKMLEIASLCDFVVGSEEFARELGYQGDHHAFLSSVAGRFPGVFTYTLGGAGSVTCVEGHVIRQEAFSVHVVDTTGAGDVFHAGYLYGVLCGWDLRTTLRFASGFAALKCRRIGGRAGIPSLAETLAFLEQNSI